METWQSDHIRQNLYELVDITSCNTALLVKLHTGGILSKYDVDNLTQIKIQRDQSMELYKILCTRRNAYDRLINALKETKQSGALHILREGFAKRSQMNSKTKHAKGSALKPPNVKELYAKPTQHLGGNTNIKKSGGKLNSKPLQTKIQQQGDTNKKLQKNLTGQQARNVPPKNQKPPEVATPKYLTPQPTSYMNGLFGRSSPSISSLDALKKQIEAINTSTQPQPTVRQMAAFDIRSGIGNVFGIPFLNYR